MNVLPKKQQQKKKQSLRILSSRQVSFGSHYISLLLSEEIQLREEISSHQFNSSNGLKPVHKTSISSIQSGSQAKPFDGIVIFLQRRREG